MQKAIRPHIYPPCPGNIAHSTQLQDDRSVLTILIIQFFITDTDFEWKENLFVLKIPDG